jgi:periplasmic divalent cation tolerance protein
MSVVLVYMTAENKEEAERIGGMLVEKRLAACANIIDNMQSVFWWDGRLDQGNETVLIAKTKQSLVEKLTQAVTEAHSYDVPCILALPVVGGNPDFIKWIEEETE